MRVLDVLITKLRGAAVYNRDVQVGPACILWPDADRHFEALVPRLRLELPELLTLGDYDPDKRSGPAIWLRCVMAGKLPDCPLPEAAIPILYLPGVARTVLRDVRSIPEHLKPLAELQFRGVTWLQSTGRDWTVLAFLKSSQGGMGLDVAPDAETRNAAQLALYRLLDEERELLVGRHLDKDYFNTLLTGGDPTRHLLQWLDQGEAFRAGPDPNAWRGFVQVCKSQLSFDPENDGALRGAELLAHRKGPWQAVWDRYREAPGRYPKLPGLLRKTTFPLDLFEDRSTWPQWNEQREADLRSALLGSGEMPAHEARKLLLETAQDHASRCQWVWAELGEAPLALAAQHLAVLAQTTTRSLAAGTVNDMAAAYVTGAWQADAAMVSALSLVQKNEDQKAVEVAIRAIYLPWCDEAARHLQTLVATGKYPGDTRRNEPAKPEECTLFVDGLRFDAARTLEQLLAEAGVNLETRPVWVPLPTVTATGKPAVAPVAHLIEGREFNVDFEPAVTSSGQSLKGGYHFRKLLLDHGIQILDSTDCGDPSGSSWTEAGNIDHEGHDRGCRLACHLDGVLVEIKERIISLLNAGWKTVRVVTDHGWLLMPGGLPKTELAAALSDNTWGRCAALKAGASSEETTYPWFWDPNQTFALAPGASCYRAGMEYAHGGLSLQESLTLSLTVAPREAASAPACCAITDVTWKGMRCKVAVEGEASGLRLDIRSQPGNPATSVVMSIRPFKADGTVSVVVEDDELKGSEATIVVIDEAGNAVAQQSTVIGKEGA